MTEWDYLIKDLDEVVHYFEQCARSRKGKRKRSMERYERIILNAQLRIEELEAKEITINSGCALSQNVSQGGVRTIG